MYPATTIARIAGLLLFAAALLAISCAERDSAPAGAGEPASEIVATTSPLADLARTIAGDVIAVGCVVPPGADAAAWRPRRDDVRRLQHAEVIIVNGADFERWLDTAAIPRSRVVDTSAGFDAELIAGATTTHSHGPAGEHSHAGTIGTTWLDPLLAAKQARAIEAALRARWPEHEAAFASRAADLVQRLETLHDRLAALAPALRERRLLALHDEYAYLARRHGLAIDTLDAEAAAGGLVLLPEPPDAALRRELEERGLRFAIVPTHAVRPADRTDFPAAFAAALDELATRLDGAAD